MSFEQIHKDGFLKIADAYKKHFMENKDIPGMIGRFKSVRACLVELYGILVKEGKCIPLESLPQEQKEDLWNEAKRICEGKGKKEMIDTCKAIHAFGTYIQL